MDRTVYLFSTNQNAGVLIENAKGFNQEIYMTDLTGGQLASWNRR
jgi:hypothetical protein